MSDGTNRPRSREHQERLAVALRENLRRRKAQSRGRVEPDAAGSEPPETMPGHAPERGPGPGQEPAP
jgi:hypothetical protein